MSSVTQHLWHKQILVNPQPCRFGILSLLHLEKIFLWRQLQECACTQIVHNWFRKAPSENKRIYCLHL